MRVYYETAVSFQHNRHDAAYLLPDQMAWRDDTSDTLKGCVESRNLSSLPGGAGASEEFLHNDRTERGKRDVAQIAWSKLGGEGGVSEHGYIDTRVEKQGGSHGSSHISRKSGALPAT